MIKLAACDDNISILNQIKELCDNYRGPDIMCDLFTSSAELLENFIPPHVKQYDAILLDIEMNEENGIDAAREIRKYDLNTIIVFVTSHDEFMEDALEVRAFRYLVKPVTEEGFDIVMNDVVSHVSQINVKFSFRFGKDNYLINCKDIYYFNKEQRIVKIITSEGIYEGLMTIPEILKRLDNDIFIDISVNMIINLDYVEIFNEDEVILKNGTKLAVSSNRRKFLKEKFMKFALHRRCR